MAKKRKEAKVRSRVSAIKDDLCSNDSDSLFEACSVVSGSCSTVCSFESNDSVKEDDLVEVEDDFESKLGQLLDNLQNSKAATKSRITHFESLKKAMSTRICDEFFADYKLTVQDILERALKRSHIDAESAASTFSLFLITMATCNDFCEDLFRELYDYLYRIMLDPTAKPSVRAKCAEALSIGCFITDYGTEKTREVLQQLISIAFISAKRNATNPDQMYELKSTCLNMFSLLASVESTSFVVACFRDNVGKLCNFLDSPNLAMRMAAGECIALLIENFRMADEDFELAQFNQICDHLHILATDSQKWRSKHDLRQQRSIFRRILSTVKGESFSEQVVTIIGLERITINCWQTKRYYDTFCSVLGSGMRLHLSQNPFLRDLFNLGPIPLLVNGGKKGKASKVEKNFYKNLIRKAREQNRLKGRSKKADFHRMTTNYLNDNK